MKARAGKKRVVLELGGNAGAIVDRTANLDWAVRRITVGAFAYSGQVCISVQRVFVHDDVFDAFAGKFVAAARALRLGDPLESETDLGPMVDEKAVLRTQAWVDEAVALGGRVLLGGRRRGPSSPPRSWSIRRWRRRSAARRRSRRWSSSPASPTSPTPSAR